ncbi:MAG: S46 family peptidase [Planctomycetota bacterium]
MRLRVFLLLNLLAGLLLTAGGATADEGMWLFNDLPKKQLKEKYGIDVTDEWAEHLMKSCVRFNVGGSASFISSNGLVLTNHHVGSDTLFKLSTAERDILKDGFLARTLGEDLTAPDLELNQLVEIRDVTAEVNAAVTSELTPEQAVAARRAVISKIEQEASDKTGLRCNVITLYGGGRYHLYHFKKYTDVRLVWAPESSIAFFGGDADNFEYPRYNLDACIFRVYENDQPAKIEHFLKWSPNGPGEDEITFVAGNPGRTSRILTVSALKFQRDQRIPFVLNSLCRREIALQQFGLAGPEAARRAKDELFGVQNSRKVYFGRVNGLQDPAIFAAKTSAESALLAKVKADPKLASSAAAWDRVAEVQKRRGELLGKGVTVSSRLFEIAETIVQMVEEDQKPTGQRLPEYSDAGRASLEQQLYSTAPIYPDLDQMQLADSMTRMVELRGADDPVCVAMLNGKSPTDRAAELTNGTALADVAARKALVQSGLAGVRNSTDPMVAMIRALDPEIRRFRKLTDELDELERQAYAQIANAIFATQGTSTYPDATFSLRLSFGPVKGYIEDGKQVPAWTDFGGAFTHELAHKGQENYDLPPSWHAAKDKLNLSTPFNFVSTADIIGGNSGSPVVNKNLELVGLIFDGNIQSLTGDFVYSDTQSRAVSVHSSAIREALRYVYKAEELADQLGK